MRQQLLSELMETGVIAILRKVDPDGIGNLASALVEGGVRAVEVTMNTRGALGMIESLARDTRLTVGAGTVLDPETARLAILAGARLIVSPNVNLEVIQTAKRYGAVVIPGAMTPTEILTAWQAGADVVKVFPSSTLGPQYFKEVKGPLDQVLLMATGGVTPENAGDFIRAGADMLGMGSALIGQASNYSLVAERVRRTVESVVQARGAR